MGDVKAASTLPRSIKLLVVTRFLPTRDFHGACTYLHDVLLYLRGRGWEIECVYLNEAPAGDRLVFHIPDAVRRVARLASPGNLGFCGRLIRFRGIGATLRKRARRGEPPAFAGGVGQPSAGSDRPPSRRELAFAAERARRFKPDVVMADFTFLAGVLADRGAERPRVRAILTHNVLHERVRSFADAGVSSAWSHWTEEKERELLVGADVIIAISEEEARTFRRMSPGSLVVVAPMSASLPVETSPEAQTPGRCLFVGGADAHNIHGLAWFVKEAWPLVLKACPGASLHVCGTAGEEMKPAPGVSLLGRVPDAELEREYARAEVCLVPILAGSGIKIKLIEALSHGRACVTTPEGLRGLGFLESGLIVASDSEGFAAGVARILNDPVFRRGMEADGRRVISEHLSKEACYGPFVRAVEEHFAEGGAAWRARP